MRDWLFENWGNILIVGVLSLIVFAVAFARIRAARRGEGTCTHGCAGCGMQGVCNGNRNNEKSN